MLVTRIRSGAAAIVAVDVVAAAVIFVVKLAIARTVEAADALSFSFPS